MLRIGGLRDRDLAVIHAAVPIIVFVFQADGIIRARARTRHDIMRVSQLVKLAKAKFCRRADVDPRRASLIRGKKGHRTQVCRD